jgi:hypothetical protein
LDRRWLRKKRGLYRVESQPKNGERLDKILLVDRREIKRQKLSILPPQPLIGRRWMRGNCRKKVMICPAYRESDPASSTGQQPPEAASAIRMEMLERWSAGRIRRIGNPPESLPVFARFQLPLRETVNKNIYRIGNLSMSFLQNTHCQIADD